MSIFGAWLNECKLHDLKPRHSLTFVMTNRQVGIRSMTTYLTLASSKNSDHADRHNMLCDTLSFQQLTCLPEFRNHQKSRNHQVRSLAIKNISQEMEFIYFVNSSNIN